VRTLAWESIGNTWFLDCHIVEVQATMFYFPQAENSTCSLTSPLPTKAVAFAGAPMGALARNDNEGDQSNKYKFKKGGWTAPFWFT